jgi:hypothetical protein
MSMELFEITECSSLLLTPQFRCLEMNERLGSQENKRGISELGVLEFNRRATRINLFTAGWRPYKQIT